MPGLGTSNEGTGHCREAGPDPQGAEMAVSPEYRTCTARDVVDPSAAKGQRSWQSTLPAAFS